MKRNSSLKSESGTLKSLVFINFKPQRENVTPNASRAITASADDIESFTCQHERNLRTGFSLSFERENL